MLGGASGQGCRRTLHWAGPGPSSHAAGSAPDADVRPAASLHCLLQPTYEKLLTEVPKYKMITPSVLADRLRVRTAAGQPALPAARCRHARQPAIVASGPVCHASQRSWPACTHPGGGGGPGLPCLASALGRPPPTHPPTPVPRPRPRPCLCAQVNGSLARAAIKELLEKGLIKEVCKHNAQQIYTRATAAAS